jgi:hypothetical protein
MSASGRKAAQNTEAEVAAMLANFHVEVVAGQMAYLEHRASSAV